MNLIKYACKYLYLVFATTLLVACVPEKGPVILNKRQKEILITASFTDGHEAGGLLPVGSAFWLGYDEVRMNSVVVHQASGEILFEIGEEELYLWQTDGMKPLVIFVDENGIRKASEQELRNERKRIKGKH